MQGRGKLKTLSRDWESGNVLLTFEMTEGVTQDTLSHIQNKDLSIEVKPYRERRSLDANALLWACIGDIAAAIGSDKWEVYLQMLKRYGKYTYVCVTPKAVEAVKKQWRECEEIGAISVNGKDAVQLLCYFGSSTYDSKEFSHLLDGVIYEMKQIGIETPANERLRQAIERWGVSNG